MGRLFLDSQVRRLLTARVLIGFSLQAVFAFLPAVLQIEKGFSTALASGSFALVFVVGSVGAPLVGRLSDLFPRVQIVLAGLIIGLISLVVMLAADTSILVVISIGTMAFGLTPLIPVMGAYFMDLFPMGSAGGDFGASKPSTRDLEAWAQHTWGLQLCKEVTPRPSSAWFLSYSSPPVSYQYFVQTALHRRVPCVRRWDVKSTRFFISTWNER